LSRDGTAVDVDSIMHYTPYDLKLSDRQDGRKYGKRGILNYIFYEGLVYTGFVFIGSFQIVACFTDCFQICIHTLLLEIHKYEIAISVVYFSSL
jgi:hypothetical protein